MGRLDRPILRPADYGGGPHAGRSVHPTGASCAGLSAGRQQTIKDEAPSACALVSETPRAGGRRFAF